MAIRPVPGRESVEWRGNAIHTLLVEGGDSSIDQQALDFFFHQNDITTVTILPLGSSSKIQAVRGALYPHHPYYYYLIDRDHHDDKTVESSWINFPNAKIGNILIWRRREIENYFLIPEYLARSPYFEVSKCSLEELQQCIRETASKRVFLDIVNMVILQLRAKLKNE